MHVQGAQYFPRGPSHASIAWLVSQERQGVITATSWTMRAWRTTSPTSRGCQDTPLGAAASTDGRDKRLLEGTTKGGVTRLPAVYVMFDGRPLPLTRASGHGAGG